MHWKYRWFIPALLLLTLFTVAGFPATAEDDAMPEAATGDPARLAALETEVAREMTQNKIPGLSIAIFDETGVFYANGFGVKDSVTQERVDADTLFVAASLSKPVTAYAALILVERGLLALDEPLVSYLKNPYLPDAKAAAKITLRMILTHTAGLSNDASGKDRKVYSAPGASFAYSSAGFRYLQQVLEDVSGAPFADFIAGTVLEPLGMNGGGFGYREAFSPNMACGHYSGKTVVREALRKVPVNASYSLIATPSDIARFARELCRPTLLGPEAVAAMIRPAVSWRSGVSWGLGIGILPRPAGNLLWHWGNNVTYQNMMLIDPRAGKGVVIMTNSSAGLASAARLAVKVANDFFPAGGNLLPVNAFDFLRNI